MKEKREKIAKILFKTFKISSLVVCLGCPIVLLVPWKYFGDYEDIVSIILGVMIRISSVVAPISLIASIIIEPLKKEEGYKRKLIAKILFIVSAILFVLPLFMYGFFDKLGYLEEIISYMWLWALLALIVGFSINPFRKDKEKIEKRANILCSILSIISFLLWLLAIVLLVISEDIAWPVIFIIVPIELILTLCFRIKYPNHKLGYIVSCINSIGIILFFSFFIYISITC